MKKKYEITGIGKKVIPVTVTLNILFSMALLERIRQVQV